MSENLGTIYYDIDVDSAPLVKSSTAAEKQLDKTEATMKRVDRTSASLTTSLSKLSVAITAVASAAALREMADMVQKYQEYEDRVKLATASTDEFNMVQKRLLATANGTYRALGEAQETYIRTADSLRALGYSTSQALDVTDSMSYAFVKNATSSDRAKTAIDALAKSVNTGKVAADQWETITSAIPSVINDIATASGKTAAEIRNLGAQGKLTAFQLTEGLRKSLQANADAAAAMSNNLVDASVRTKTAVTQVLVSLESQTGALQAFTNGIIKAADAVLLFGTDSEKMESFLQAATTAAAALGSVMAGRVLMALGSYGVAQGQALTATLAKIAADREAAAQAVLTARADLAAAEAAVARAAGMKAVALSSADFNRATVATQQAQLQLETAAMNVATAVSNQGKVVGLTTIALNGMKTAMAFLGGPAGLILLAATAIYTFADGASKAKKETDALNGSLEKLSFNQLGRVALQAEENIQGMNQELANAKKAYGDLLLAKPTMDQEKFNKRMTEAAAALDDVNGRVKAQKDRLEEVKKAQDALGKTPVSAAPTENKVSAPEDPTAKGVIKGLNDQLALLKVIGVERAKLAAIQKLGDEASPAQRIEAEKLAASIYQLELAEKQQKASKAKGESAAAAAIKKAAAEEKKGIEDNQKAFSELGFQLASVQKTARELAQDQAQLSLNKYATPEQVQTVRDMAGALYDLKGARQLLAEVDPIAAQQINYAEDLKALQDANDQKLISDQRYLELKHIAETENAEKMRLLQEENFKAQSVSNQVMLESVDAVGRGITTNLSSILAGTGSLKSALAGIADTVLNTVIGAFVQMGVNWVKQQIMMRVATQATEAAQITGIGAVTAAQAGATTAIAATTTTTAATTGAAVAGSMAPAAGLSSIASFGSAAVIGGAALLGTMLLAKSFGGGRRAGGGVSADSVYRVNEGGAPEVFNAGGQQYMIPNQRGEVVSNKNAMGGAGVTNNIQISIDSSGNSTVSGDGTGDSRQLAGAMASVCVDVLQRELNPGGILWGMQNGQ